MNALLLKDIFAYKQFLIALKISKVNFITIIT